MNAKEQAKAQAELNKLVKAGTISQREAKDLMDKMVVSGQQTAQAFQKILANIKKITPELKKSEVALASMEELEDALIDKVATLQNGLKGNLKEFNGIGEATQDIVFNLTQKYRAELKSGKLTKEAYKELTKSALEAGRLARSMETISNSKMAPVFDDLMDDMEAVSEKIGGLFDKIPGGSYLFKMLGGDELTNQLQGAAANGMAAMSKAMQAGMGPLQALQAGMAAFNATVMINPILLVVAAVIGLTALLVAQNKKYREQAEAAGVSLAVAKQQVIAAKQQVATGQTILANTEDILEAQNAVNDAMGTSLAMNAENAAAVADIGEAMGYGAKAAGESAAAMMQMGVAAADVADMQMETNLMAVKAGVDMAKVQSDIAENAGKVSAYFAGNPKALAKAAVEAAKMGMSLSDMADISDKLLDFESSISAQFELQALTGRQMNFDKARQLALEGDIAGASAAVLEQVGSIHDFNKMDVLERKKLAEATGMSVEQLQKSLTIQSMRGDLTEDELAAAQGLNLSAAELKDLTADELKQKLASQDATAKMAQQMAQLKETAMMALQPLMDILSVVFNILAPIMKIGQFINNLMLIPLKAVLGVIKGVFDALMTALQPVMDIFNEIGSLLGGSGGIGEMFSKIGEIIGTVIFLPIKIIANILKAVLLPVINVIAEVFSIIGDIITAIGEAIDTYLIQPIEKAVDLLSYLNPMNWFGGGDDAEVEVTADGEALESAGSVDDGVIQDGKIVSTNPADTLIATKDPGGLLGSLGKGLMSMSPLGMLAGGIGKLFGGGEATGQEDTSLEILTQINEKLDQIITPASAEASSPDSVESKPIEADSGGLLSKIGDFAGQAFSMTPMGMAAGALGDLFGKDEKSDSATMQDVINAISNIEINLDGKKVSNGVRVAGSFTKKG